MRKGFLLLSVLGCFVALSAGARADDSMMVENAWSRAAIAGRNGVVYFSVMDMGGADRLLGADTPVAAKAELHQSSDNHGVMQMRPVDAVPLAAGATVTFAPGGLHVMLIGLKHALKEGETFPLTLHFEKAGNVQTIVKVGKAGGMDMKMN
jgi:copper(I)-binding protein